MRSVQIEPFLFTVGGLAGIGECATEQQLGNKMRTRTLSPGHDGQGHGFNDMYNADTCYSPPGPDSAPHWPLTAQHEGFHTAAGSTSRQDVKNDLL